MQITRASRYRYPLFTSYEADRLIPGNCREASIRTGGYVTHTWRSLACPRSRILVQILKQAPLEVPRTSSPRCTSKEKKQKGLVVYLQRRDIPFGNPRRVGTRSRSGSRNEPSWETGGEVEGERERERERRTTSSSSLPLLPVAREEKKASKRTRDASGSLSSRSTASPRCTCDLPVAFSFKRPNLPE